MLTGMLTVPSMTSHVGQVIGRPRARSFALFYPITGVSATTSGMQKLGIVGARLVKVALGVAGINPVNPWVPAPPTGVGHDGVVRLLGFHVAPVFTVGCKFGA